MQAPAGRELPGQRITKINCADVDARSRLRQDARVDICEAFSTASSGLNAPQAWRRVKGAKKGVMMKTLSKSVLLGGMLFTSGVVFSADTPHWTYSGEGGPEKWAKLSAEFGACRGKNQSPINLTGFIESELKPIKISYQAGGNEILNNGHTVQVNYATGSSISVDGIQFDLKQFHFHAPSENHINGQVISDGGAFGSRR